MSILILLISLCYLFLILFLMFGFSRMPDFSVKDHPSKTRFSVIIPFRNEAENLPLLFASLKRLNYPTELFEIILVNDASEDASEALAEKFLEENQELQLSLLQNSPTSKSPKKDAITKAINAARHEYIITTDADCSVPETWLQEFNTMVSETNSKMIAGPVKILSSKKFLHTFQEIDFFSLQGATMGGFGVNQPFMCNGANFCYEKQAFFTVNGFDGNKKIASGDDIFLLEKFRKAGFKAVFIKSKSAIVQTLAQPTWKDFFAQRIRWAAKTSAYNNSFGKLVGLLVFFMNFILAIAVIGVLLKKLSSSLLLIPFLLKFNVDFILIYQSARFFERERVLKNYFWCSLIYPFLSSYIAVLSLFTGYSWKGRSFKK